MLKHSTVLATQAIIVDLFISFFLAILPILVIFVGLVFLKQSGTLMGFVGWMLTVIIAVLFFSTSPRSPSSPRRTGSSPRSGSR